MTHSFQPEWAPTRAVLLVWPFAGGAWRANYQQVVSCYWDMLSAISQAAPIWLLYHPDLDAAAFLQELEGHGINAERITIINDVPYDDTWIRDYGPLTLGSSYLSYTFNGWGGKYLAVKDDQVPTALAPILGEAPVKLDFVCEGGALETNGRYLLANADCVVDEQRNPGLSQQDVEQQLLQDLGLERVFWLRGAALSGDDTDGHIDTIVRFADAETLIYSGRNELHVDARVLSELHEQVQALAQSQGWKAFELPTPVYRSLLDERVLPCTYANFLIANQRVFAPIYGLAEDDLALSVLREAFPTYRVVPVRCEALLEQHGSLHCATMQVAKLNY